MTGRGARHSSRSMDGHRLIPVRTRDNTPAAHRRWFRTRWLHEAAEHSNWRKISAILDKPYTGLDASVMPANETTHSSMSLTFRRSSSAPCLAAVHTRRDRRRPGPAVRRYLTDPVPQVINRIHRGGQSRPAFTERQWARSCRRLEQLSLPALPPGCASCLISD